MTFTVAFIGTRIITDEVAERTLTLLDVFNYGSILNGDDRISLSLMNETPLDATIVGWAGGSKWPNVRIRNATSDLSSRYASLRGKAKDSVNKIIPGYFKKLSVKNYNQFADIVSMIVQEEVQLVVAVRNPITKAGRGLFALKVASFFRIPHIDLLDDSHYAKILKASEEIERKKKEEKERMALEEKERMFRRTDIEYREAYGWPPQYLPPQEYVATVSNSTFSTSSVSTTFSFNYNNMLTFVNNS